MQFHFFSSMTHTFSFIIYHAYLIHQLIKWNTSCPNSYLIYMIIDTFYSFIFSILLVIFINLSYNALFSLSSAKRRKEPKPAIFSKFNPKPRIREEQFENEKYWRIEFIPMESQEKWRFGLVLEEKWRNKQEESVWNI